MASEKTATRRAQDWAVDRVRGPEGSPENFMDPRHGQGNMWSGARRAGSAAETGSQRYADSAQANHMAGWRLMKEAERLGKDRDSIVGERLRQGLQSGLAGQAAQAAGGGAMGLRNAMGGYARGADQMNQAAAGQRLGEDDARMRQRMEAMRAYTDHLGRTRAQDLDVALRSNAQNLEASRAYENAAQRRWRLEHGLAEKSRDRTLGAMAGGASLIGDAYSYFQNDGGGATVSGGGQNIPRSGGGSVNDPVATGRGYVSPIAGEY